MWLSCTKWRLFVPLGWHFQHPGGAGCAASAGVSERSDPCHRNRAQHSQDWWCGEWCWHHSLSYPSFTSTRTSSVICCASECCYCVEYSHFVCCLRPVSLLITAAEIKCVINNMHHKARNQSHYKPRIFNQRRNCDVLCFLLLDCVSSLQVNTRG